MIKKYKIIFDKDFDNQKAMESFKSKIPLFLLGMSKEQLDLNLEKIRLQNPKRFEILKEYIDKFQNNNNGLHR